MGVAKRLRKPVIGWLTTCEMNLICQETSGRGTTAR